MNKQTRALNQSKALTLEELADHLGGYCWASEEFQKHGEQLQEKAQATPNQLEAALTYYTSWGNWTAVHRAHVELWHTLLPDSPALKAQERVKAADSSWEEVFEIYGNPLQGLANQPDSSDAIQPTDADTPANASPVPPADSEPAPPTGNNPLASDNSNPPEKLLAFEMMATELLLGRLIQQLSSLRWQMQPLAEAPELRITRQILDDWVLQADETAKFSRSHGFLLPNHQSLSTLAGGENVAVQIRELAQVVIF